MNKIFIEIIIHLENLFLIYEKNRVLVVVLLYQNNILYDWGK